MYPQFFQVQSSWSSLKAKFHSNSFCVCFLVHEIKQPIHSRWESFCIQSHHQVDLRYVSVQARSHHPIDHRWVPQSLKCHHPHEHTHTRKEASRWDGDVLGEACRVKESSACPCFLLWMWTQVFFRTNIVWLWRVLCTTCITYWNTNIRDNKQIHTHTHVHRRSQWCRCVRGGLSWMTQIGRAHEQYRKQRRIAYRRAVQWPVRWWHSLLPNDAFEVTTRALLTHQIRWDHLLRNDLDWRLLHRRPACCSLHSVLCSNQRRRLTLRLCTDWSKKERFWVRVRRDVCILRLMMGCSSAQQSSCCNLLHRR